MLKKRMLGVGIVGIGVLCMLMNATGNVVFLSPGIDLSGWNVQKTQGQTVEAVANVGHTGEYSLNVSTPFSGNHYCYVTSPAMIGFSGSTRYMVEMQIYLPSVGINGFCVFYNGQINLRIYGSSLIAHWNGGGGVNVANVPTGAWQDILIDVNGPNRPTGFNYAIYYQSQDNPVWSKFWSNPTTKVLMGDTESGSTNYGTMYFDAIRIWHIGPFSSNLKNYDLFEEFNAGHLDATTNPWTVYKDAGSTACPSTDKGTSDFYGASGIHIKCTKNNQAWATTPPNAAFNKYNDYMVSMWIKLPQTTNNNFFIVVANQEIFIFVAHDNVLHWCTSTTYGEFFTMEYNTWYLLKCIVSPSAHRYDIYIGNVKKTTTPVDTYYSNGEYYAWNYLGLGIDTANSGNWGEMYWDDVRVNQP